MNDIYQANYQVETSLGDVVRAIWRRKWIILLITLLFLVGTYFYTQRLPKQWVAQAQLLIVERADAGSAGSPGAAYIAPAPDSISTQIGMLRTAAMADRAVSWLRNKEMEAGQPADASGVSAGSLQGSINAVNPTDSNLIDISVFGSSRDQALLLTDAVAQSFVQWKADEARQDVQATIGNLIPRTKAARRQLDAAMRKQLSYQKGHEMLDSGSQARIGVQRLTSRTDAVTTIQAEMDAEETTANSLKAQLAAQNHSIQQTGPRDDSYTAGLSSRLSDLKIQRADLARRVTPAYPGKLPLLDQQIADLQRQLTAAVKATQNTNSSTLPAQANLEQSYQQALIQLATTQRRLADAVALKNEASAAMTPLVETGSTYDQIAREAQEADANYSGLEAALVSARLRESQTNSDIQITQSAVAPDAPAKPNPSLNMLMGGLLGLLVSLAAVFIIEQTDRRVRTEDQVERLGSGPILGALPRLSRAALAQLDRKQLPIPVAESYSLAGANLLRVLGSPQPGNGRIVMVTSAQAGEGKSLTAAELARSLARSGKHVILVDVDMRRPALNTLFDDAPEEGLVEVLSGKSLLDDALTASETPNLSVLFNNASRVNSADIIVSPHMTNFLQMVRNRAEIIVLDAPSCTVVDPLLLAPSVDYVLQVIDLGRANEDAVNSTSSVLSGLAPLGLFINRTNKRNAPAYEVARSFAATLAPPALAGGSAASPFSPDHTLMMFRNTSGYTPGTLDGASDPLANDRQDAHDLTIPLKNREDH
jgi:capsular exopolysaccharide synthesis family protein